MEMNLVYAGLGFLGFVLLVLFFGLVVFPRMRHGHEKAFDAVNFLQSLRFWTS